MKTNLDKFREDLKKLNGKINPETVKYIAFLEKSLMAHRKELEKSNSLETVKNWLKNLAEDKKLPMDVRVYNEIWGMIQSIDHELEKESNSLRK